MQADTLDGRLPEAAGWQRWKLATVLMVTVFIAYYDRLNISLALPLIAEQYGWGLEQKQFYGSLLMGLFFGAYGIANIFLTPWGARVGPRASLLLIICLWSLFTALGALASQWLAVFLASRVLLGLAEGIHFPMMSQLTKHWFPPHERSRANGLWIAGLFLAILSAPLLLVPLMHHLGWRAGFVLLSLAGLVISLPLVWRYVHNWPADHPRIQGAERGYIEVGLMGEASAAAQPLGSVARQPVFLLMVLVGILNNVLSLGISSWLPTYLASREGVAYQDLAYLAALPYSFSLLGLAFWSWLGDRSGRRGRNAMFGFVCAGGMIFAAFE
ncbi:MAG: MFS transporter, partial [Haliea sp.]